MTAVSDTASGDLEHSWELLKRLDGKEIYDEVPRTPKIKVSPTFRTFKVIILGDSDVGKTCLAVRTCSGEFPKTTTTTIGVDFKEKQIKVEDEIIRLQLWDSAGQERFRCNLVAQYYRNVHAVIFVYDITKRSSFDNLRKWLDELHKNVGVPNTIPQLIIGNKCDQHADRVVRTSEAKALANSYGLPLWETSVKSDMEKDTIKSIFQSLAETLKLKTPLLEFPPHYSNMIQADHLKGLRVNQSLSGSSGSKSASPKPRRSKTQREDVDNCCGVG